MYVSTYREEMPTGRGLEWITDGSHFKKKLIAPKQISLASLEWLEYMNHDPRFVDKNGVRQFIQHGWSSAEVKVENYPVDGFVAVDGKNYILEFDGCYFVSYSLSCLEISRISSMDARRVKSHESGTMTNETKRCDRMESLSLCTDAIGRK